MFFPCVTGHAKLIDEYHSSRNYPYYSTFRNENIKFFYEDAEDPDYMVKLGYSIMIGAVSEVESGVENIWKRGGQTGTEIIQFFEDTWLNITSRHFKVQLRIVLLIRSVCT